MNYLKELRKQVWKKAIKSEIRDINKTYCKLIAQKVSIAISTPDQQKKIDWETVRDFFEGNRTTSIPTLNKFSAYVLSDWEATYSNFQSYCDETLEKEKERKQIVWWHSKYFKIGTATAMILSVLAFWIVYENRATDFGDHFNGEQFSDLKNWQIVDVDSNYISLDRGLLKLHTLPGDYWIDMRQGEKPIIKNFLFRKLNCKECQIDITIRHFHPNMMAQQVGVFLLDKKGNSFDRQRYVRYTYAYGGYNSVDEEENHWEVVQVVEQLREGTIPSAIELPLRYYSNGNRRYAIWHLLILRIVITKEKYTFSWTLGDTDAHNIVYDLPRIVEPQYLGIGAFQGFTNNRGEPFNADTIPAYIDEISVRPLR